MKRRHPQLRAGDFTPHPDDAEAVRFLAGKYKWTRFKLNPMGRVWAVTECRISDLDSAVLLRLPELIEFNTGQMFGRPRSSFTRFGFANLCTHAKLTAFLDCFNPMLGNGAAQVIGNSTRLRWVHLGGCGITNDGVIEICKAKQLLVLSLFQNDITEDVLDCLSGLTNLRHLNIRETKISRDAAMDLQKHLTRCKIDVLLPENAV